MTRKPPEFTAFEKLTDRLLAVPRKVVEDRMAEHKKRAALNPKKRGPKPKRSITPPSDADPA